MAARKHHHNRPLLWWSALASVCVVLAKVLVAGTTFKFGEVNVAFGPIDGGLVVALLGPTLTALVAQGHNALRDLDGDGKPDAP